MSLAQQIPIDTLQELLPYMTPEQSMRALRLVKVIQSTAPTPKPVTAGELVELETNLAAFVKASWLFLNPGRKLVWSWHYDLLCEYLTLVKQRKLKRLILNVPPRTAKSTIATICFPCWVWLTEPSHAFLCASYSNSLSTDHSVARRNLITSPWFQSFWADKFQLSSDRNLTTQFANDKMGQMIATSTGSGAEGRGGDTAILDDPMSSQQSLSDTERTAANRWVDNTLRQRLNDPATAAIIVIMQRLHELDTTGFVLSQDPGVWTEIVIPLEAEKDEEFVFPISGRVIERKKGDILQPDRFTPDIVLEKQRNRMVYAGQYQQRPAPLEGNLIKRSEVKYYGGKDPVTCEADEPLPEFFNRTLISVDCSFKDKAESDYVAIGVIGVKGRKRYLRNIVNAHLDAAGTELEIRRQKLTYPEVTAILVEDKANGPAVIQRLKANLAGVIEVNPQGGKVARMYAAAPEWQAGDWYVDRTAAWSEPFVDQITQFPTAAHDDMCDMMSQAAIWLGGSGTLLIYGEYWSDDVLYNDESRPISLYGRGGFESHIVGVECGTARTGAFVEVLDDGTTIWNDREYCWEGAAKTDLQIADALQEFIAQSRVSGTYPKVVLKSGMDGLKRELRERGMWITEQEDDESMLGAIRRIGTAFSVKRLRIKHDCTHTIHEHQIYSWNPEKYARGEEEPLRRNDSTCNALRRAVQSILATRIM